MNRSCITSAEFRTKKCKPDTPMYTVSESTVFVSAPSASRAVQEGAERRLSLLRYCRPPFRSQDVEDVIDEGVSLATSGKRTTAIPDAKKSGIVVLQDSVRRLTEEEDKSVNSS